MPETFDDSFAQSLKKQQAILHERALALAREAEHESKEEHLELLLFSLAEESYGIETNYVDEVFALHDLTVVPGAPAFIAGIVNVHGTMLTLVDLKKLLDLQETGIADIHQVITIRNDRMKIGLLADKIIGIEFVKVSELQSSLPTLTGLRSDYLKGVTSSGLVVLDVEKLLEHDRLIVDQTPPALAN